MAINLGDITFGIGPDTRKLYQAIRLLENFNRVGKQASAMPIAAGVSAGIAAFSLIATTAVNSARQIQKVELALGAVAGAADMAAKSIDYLRGVSDRSGVSFESIAHSYTKLEAASKGTNLEGERTREIFEAVTFAGAKLGLSAEEVGGALKAIEQIMSKGTVQAEELRGQLGDRLPGAFNMMAQALGITTEKLSELMKKGQITSDALIPFAEQLKESFNVDTAADIDTIAAAEGRLSNAFLFLGKATDEALGISKAYITTLNTLAAAINTLSFVLDGGLAGWRNINEAVGEQAAALQRAAGASKTFRNELKAQITMQRNAARVALNEASAQLTAAMAKMQAAQERLENTSPQDRPLWEDFLDIGIMGWERAFNVEPAAEKVDALRITLKALDDQLQQINALQTSMGDDKDGLITPITDPEATASSIERVSKAIREAMQSISSVNADVAQLDMDPLQKLKAESWQEINEKVSTFKDRLTDAKVPLAEATLLTNQYAASLQLLADKQIRLEYFPSMWQSLGDTLTNSVDPVFDQLIDSWIEGADALQTLGDIGKMVATQLLKDFTTLAVVNPLKNVFGSIFGLQTPLMPTFGSFGGGGGGGMPFSLTNAGSYAGGGSFEIGGGPTRTGSLDDQLVSFWGKRGEKVNISKSGHSADGGGNYYEGNTYYIDAQGAAAGVEERMIALIQEYDKGSMVRTQRDLIKGRRYRKPGIAKG
jgi:tape measure domain-containing protein